MRYFRSKKSFTLIEIMIVVTILALLAAIAIPGLLRARHNANESASIGSMRTFSSALESYRATQTSFPSALTDLSNASPPYVDSTLTGASSSGTAKQGYYYTYSQVNANQYTLTANPATANVTGTRVFFVDESGVIRLTNASGSPIS